MYMSIGLRSRLGGEYSLFATSCAAENPLKEQRMQETYSLWGHLCFFLFHQFYRSVWRSGCGFWE